MKNMKKRRKIKNYLRHPYKRRSMSSAFHFIVSPPPPQFVHLGWLFESDFEIYRILHPESTAVTIKKKEMKNDEDYDQMEKMENIENIMKKETGKKLPTVQEKIHVICMCVSYMLFPLLSSWIVFRIRVRNLSNSELRIHSFKKTTKNKSILLNLRMVL